MTRDIQRQRVSKSWAITILSVILGISLAINIGLAWKLILPRIWPNKFSKVEGLKIGTVLPICSFKDLTGRKVSLGDFQDSQKLLIFSDPNCGACNRLYESLNGLTGGISDNVKVIIISSSEEAKNKETALKYNLKVPILSSDWKTFSEIYKIRMIPHAYLVDKKNIIIGTGQGVSGTKKILEQIQEEKH